MEVIRINHKHIPYNLASSVACIGYFDGFHRGHQELMKRTISSAKKRNCQAALISFDPDPWEIFNPNTRYTHVTTVYDRIDLAEAMGFDVFYILTFSLEFSKLHTSEFHDLLHSLKVEKLICGFDFQYGTKNSGNIHTLKNQDFFDVHVVDSVQDGLGKISTSRIELLIQEGDFIQVSQLLGYAYSVDGKVVHGFKRGSTILQIPTANLDMDPEYIQPGLGVYAGFVLWNGDCYPAMINIGKNPTFDNEMVTLEAHILDFHESIYDEQVRFGFLEKIRSEQKFANVHALKAQLLKDILTTRGLCKKNQQFMLKTYSYFKK